ncbi:hypothetical protein H5410_009629 [Solanum commersonii]|uniref:Uncharacterized protein n=1 Tax=Solanum commersonii TaxID=4109 RepID=A0A9J6AJA7_SOLCO|nr:hypothetical protein H5410_009629 [Solanum commersonii]
MIFIFYFYYNVIRFQSQSRQVKPNLLVKFNSVKFLIQSAKLTIHLVISSIAILAIFASQSNNFQILKNSKEQPNSLSSNTKSAQLPSPIQYFSPAPQYSPQRPNPPIRTTIHTYTPDPASSSSSNPPVRNPASPDSSSIRSSYSIPAFIVGRICSIGICN